ncbi:uncharacterized protein LOC126371638 [Pectinophora gossypiella]|uniref:uncharacterized protein LOC126371638 n=1 Tax=Pectinophora gossypiella TaxID=13191 RepID=UPI00214E17AD|nr:uncharacterized protein LOC126371638 [Pectinophora gossypiella]
MASFLSVFTLASITTQTTLSILVSWFTLECRFQPAYLELESVTLAKLLYLHDPEACGRVFFYNQTIQVTRKVFQTTLQWPVKNNIAAEFRQRIKLWVALHVLWLVSCIGYMTQSHRQCAFYAALIPFSLTGLTILLLDLFYMALFLVDTANTGTEVDILNYINRNNDSVHHINKSRYQVQYEYKLVFGRKPLPDTSWISLLFAYASCRGVVLWLFNFWMVKDNYFEGLATFQVDMRDIGTAIQDGKDASQGLKPGT